MSLPKIIAAAAMAFLFVAGLASHLLLARSCANAGGVYAPTTMVCLSKTVAIQPFSGPVIR